MPYKDPEKRREMDKFYGKRYRQTEKGRAAVRRGKARYYAAHGADVRARQASERTKAYARVAVEIKAGRIKREHCIVCSYRDTHAHHFNGYEGAAALQIVWLCRAHHQEAHYRMGLPRQRGESLFLDPHGDLAA